MKEAKMAEDYNFDKAFKKQYKDYSDTGGFSKKMIKTYGVTLAADIAFGWFILPLNLWIASVCFFVCLPPLFFYRFCQYAMKIFGPINTPLVWHRKRVRWSLIIVGLSFLSLSIFLAYPFIQSIPVIVFVIIATFWFINRLVRHHMSVTFWAMEQDRKLRKDK